MGRSKFPGKPSKHVNRTRINVLPTPTTTTTVGDSNNVVTVETGNDLKKVNIENCLNPFIYGVVQTSEPRYCTISTPRLFDEEKQLVTLFITYLFLPNSLAMLQKNLKAYC